MKKEVVVIGAGLVGSLLSIYLVKQGYAVRVYERRGDMRKKKVEVGRSINLALSDRGIKALQEVGIIEKILQIAIPMHGRFIHNLDGSTALQPYGKQGQFINSISRRELNCRLMDLAEQEGAQFFFHMKCLSVNWETNEVLFEIDGINDKPNSVKADLVFGADGAFSAARLAHMLQHPNFNYQNPILIVVTKNSVSRQENMEKTVPIRQQSDIG